MVLLLEEAFQKMWQEGNLPDQYKNSILNFCYLMIRMLSFGLELFFQIFSL